MFRGGWWEIGVGNGNRCASVDLYSQDLHSRIALKVSGGDRGVDDAGLYIGSKSSPSGKTRFSVLPDEIETGYVREEVLRRKFRLLQTADIYVVRVEKSLQFSVAAENAIAIPLHDVNSFLLRR